MDRSSIVYRQAGVTYSAEEKILTGSGFMNLGSDFVVGMSDWSAINSSIGARAYRCRVIDNNRAVVFCPAGKLQESHYFESFAIPLNTPRTLVEVEFR